MNYYVEILIEFYSEIRSEESAANLKSDDGENSSSRRSNSSRRTRGVVGWSFRWTNVPRPRLALSIQISDGGKRERHARSGVDKREGKFMAHRSRACDMVNLRINQRTRWGFSIPCSTRGEDSSRIANSLFFSETRIEF